MTARVKIWVGLGFALALFAAAGWISYTNTARFIQASNRVTHTYRVRERLITVFSLLKDAEAGVRGYVITGRDEYLRPYQSALRGLDRDLNDLQVLTADNPEQQRRLNDLRPLVDARLDELRRVAGVRRKAGLPAAAEMIATGSSKRMTRAVRAMIGDMKNAESALLKQREAVSRAQTRNVLLTLWIGVALGFSVLLFVIYLLNREIGERERAAVALRDSEDRLRLLVESVKDYAIFMLDPDGRVASWNAGAERIKGYRAAEIVGRHFSCFYTPEAIGRDAPARALQVATAEGRFETEAWRVRKDGSRFLANVILTAMRDGDGRLRGYTKVTRDITDYRQAQEKLVESESRYRAVSELTSDYAYAFHIEPSGASATEWVTGAFTRITGYTIEEVDARGGGIGLVHPDDLSIALARVQTLVSGEPDTSEFRIITKDGTIRWLRETGRPGWDEVHQRVRVFGAAQDITERRQAEEQARQHQAELAHVLRVSTVGEMVIGLAHEINQPLAAIVSYAKGSARRMQAGAGNSGELLGAMEEIAAQAVRADQIVRRLRNFVRKQEPRRERVNLNDLVRDVARLVARETADRGVTMRLDLSPGMPPVSVDSIQIEQVILNLVRNGFEAMHGPDPERSVLSIHTAMAGHDVVEVAVSDAGEGLADSHADKLFNPFFTTKANGLGMGLSISRSIVEAHGGRLWFTPNPDRGATFRFTVPTSNGDANDAT